MNGISIYQGDVRNVLPNLPAESVNCVVTSPPYWGLRDYGTAKWEGGAAACDHRHPGERRQLPHGDGRTNDCYADERVLIPGVGASYKETCGKCGAIRIDSQLGLESTPEEYIANMVRVFRDVKRVLRSDGTLWLNMGDSYASGDRATWRSGASENKGQDVQNDMPRPKTPPGLKPKDLCGIPWMLAFALRADGWYLRQDIIWAKPNPMPESVTDRCTKAHEYIFLLSKSERYHYDAGAIAETSVTPDDPMRNKRSVWTVVTQPFPEVHFATFPEELIKPCILAGCPAGGTILDPFFGSGTTGLVARRNGCKCIGIELNPEYIKIAERRLAQEVMFV